MAKRVYIIVIILFSTSLVLLQMGEFRQFNKRLPPIGSRLHVKGSSNGPKTPRNLLIVVKTTRKNHDTRLRSILETWYQLAPQSIHFVTDYCCNMSDSEEWLKTELGVRLHTSPCGEGHFASALCCKLQVELNVMDEKATSWSCHFDDDNYVNIPQLRELLGRFNSSEEIYIGRKSVQGMSVTIKKKNILFTFATGGAGICLSLPLVKRLRRLTSTRSMERFCAETGVPDDCTLGFVIEHELGVNLTEVQSLHSHLEGLSVFDEKYLREQASLSGVAAHTPWNTLRLGRELPNDSLKFKALHCLIFPTACSFDENTTTADLREFSADNRH